MKKIIDLFKVLTGEIGWSFLRGKGRIEIGLSALSIFLVFLLIFFGIDLMWGYKESAFFCNEYNNCTRWIIFNFVPLIFLVIVPIRFYMKNVKDNDSM